MEDQPRISGLQVRHPLAQAQWANHPSKGSEPNVMVAAFDFLPSSLQGQILHFILLEIAHPDTAFKALQNWLLTDPCTALLEMCPNQLQ